MNRPEISDHESQLLFDTAVPSESRLTGLRKIKSTALTSLSNLVLPLVQRAARDHVGGESVDDAICVAQRLAVEGFPTSLGFWDTPSYTPDQIRDIYVNSIRLMHESGLDTYISIKPPALRYDPAAADAIAAAGRQHNIRVHCDSHGIETADLTFQFLERLRQGLDASCLSITLPGRWRRSVIDADWAVAKGVAVRVVKGEWPDPQDRDRDLREGFLEVVGRLADRATHVAVASHDLPLASRAMTLLKDAGTACELELIYSLRQEAVITWAEQNETRVRIYVPYGKGFIPNALRTLRRKPRLTIQIARQMLIGR